MPFLIFTIYAQLTYYLDPQIICLSRYTELIFLIIESWFFGGTSFYHNVPQGHHKIQGTTRNLCVFLPQGYPRDTKRNYDVSQGYPMTLQGTTRTSWSTLHCLYMVPQGIPRVLCHVTSIYKVPQGIPRVLYHVYIMYHKESLEYLAMSI
jgi:hypothetical protein